MSAQAVAQQPMPRRGSWDSTQSDDEEDETQPQQGELEDGEAVGPYATLQNNGPTVSGGSAGHPEGCTPCTFYCFTRRGCNRGETCKFCHLAHQSKLQLRRETWKKQQREKRKSTRERATQDGAPRRIMGGKEEQCGTPQRMLKASESRATGLPEGMAALLPSLGGAGAWSEGYRGRDALKGYAAGGEQALAGGMPSTLIYTPGRAVLAIGQQAEFRPPLLMVPVSYRLLAPLPRGLRLDTSTGVIHGAAEEPCQPTTVIIEATPLGAYPVAASFELEVVDFTQGGFAVGHISELEPGRYMLVLHAPEQSEAGEYPTTLGHNCGGDGAEGTNRRAVDSCSRGGSFQAQRMHQATLGHARQRMRS